MKAVLQVVPLSDLATPRGVKAGKNSNLPVYSVTKHNGFVPSLEYFNKQVFSRDLADYKLVEPGELAYATIHLDEGSIGLCPERCLISPMYTTFRVNEQKVDATYLCRFLKSPKALAQYPQLGKGSVERRRAISFDRLSRLEIPLPPLAEQRRIAGVLDKAEALRAKRRAALAQLDALTQSLFLDLFGDPVANSKGWHLKAFGEICETRLGKMLDQKQQTGQHLRPYLRNANVQWFKFDLAEVFEMDFDEKARSAFRLKEGDLLICEGGEPGRAAVWHGDISECYYQKALHRARPRGDLAIAEFLAWQLWFLAHRGGLGDHVTSATIAHLTGEKLNAMKVPLPPLDLQREFARRVAAVEKLKTAQRAALAELDALFASLQHRAFRGEL